MRTVDSIKTECWDEAFHCFATSAIFERRANGLRFRVQILTFLGIALPASIGALFMTYGGNSAYFSVAISVVSLLSLIQLIGSIWSVTAGWDSTLQYALESMSANRIISESFRALATDTPKPTEANLRYSLIQTESQARSNNDDKQGISEKEKRFGMRAGLRQFRRTCATCGEMPKSMTPTNCMTCGRF